MFAQMSVFSQWFLCSNVTRKQFTHINRWVSFTCTLLLFSFSSHTLVIYFVHLSMELEAAIPDREKGEKDPVESPEEEDVVCGIAGWRFKSLEKYRTLKCFIPLFSLIIVTQGTYYTYLITCVSTLEKRYKYSSKLSGSMLIADNIACLILSPIVGYLGKKMNKVTLISVGMFSCSLCCFLTALPYFIYGSEDDQLLASVDDTVVSHKKNELEFCSVDNPDKCKGDTSATIWPAYIIIWVASFLNGVGYTALTILGLVFVDDNVKKTQAPLYVALISAVRLLGPTGAYLLSSFALSLPENPSSPAIYKKSDPRFLGAWWIGFLVIGSALFFFTMPLLLFPGELDSVRVKRENEKKSKGGLKAQLEEVKASLRRLSASRVWVLDTISHTFGYIGGVGYHMLLPKYLQTQYHKSASDASFMTGAYSISSAAAGMLLGGLTISYFKPRPRMLATYVLIIGFICTWLFIAKFFLGCPQSPIFALEENFVVPCNENCHCNRGVMQPVCSSDGQKTFLTPCFAGCKKSPIESVNVTFDSCSCDPSYSLGTFTTSGMKEGYCDVKCDNFTIYMILTAITRFLGSTCVSVGFLLRFRSISEEDKPFAAGLGVTIHTIFAAIPGPVVFGAIADAACSIWQESCDKKGNCWLYDADKFRLYLHGGTLFFGTCGYLCNILIWYYSKDVKNLYHDEPQEEKKEQQKEPESEEMLAETKI